MIKKSSKDGLLFYFWQLKRLCYTARMKRLEMHTPSATSAPSLAQGFTIVELLIIVVVIAILAAVVLVSYKGITDRARMASASSSLYDIADAMKQYKVFHKTLPDDVEVGIPPEIVLELTNREEEMVDTGIWPGSYYDYEVWDLNADGIMETYQISIRFCRNSQGQPVGEGGTVCRFPGNSWASNFVDISSFFYCLEGYCRAHGFEGNAQTPAYCVNCPDNKPIPLP